MSKEDNLNNVHAIASFPLRNKEDVIRNNLITHSYLELIYSSSQLKVSTGRHGYVRESGQCVM